jgi:hypothetical protein
MGASKWTSAALVVAIVVGFAQAQDEKTIGATGEKVIANPPMLRTSMIVGKTFATPQGEKLGEVRDIVLEPGGCIGYAVVAYTGVTDRLFAVPWSAFTTTGDTIALAITMDRIKAAPSFEINKWPDMNDERFINEVYTFYGQKPHLDRRHKVVEEAEVFPAGSFDSTRIKTYAGTVVRYDDVRGYVTVRVGNEPERVIQVAPSSYLLQERLELRPNDNVTFKAAEVDRNGERVLIGTEVRKDDRVIMLRDERGNPKWRRVEKEHEKEKDRDHDKKDRDHDKDQR